MENNKELQEFDLDEILNEFHDLTETDTLEVEPDQELKDLLKLPEIEITPVVVKTPALPQEPAVSADATVRIPTPEEKKASAALDGDTVAFSAITEEQIAAAAEAAKAAAEAQTVPEDATRVLPETPAPQEQKAEPAFEVEPEFIPSPIVFTPHSRLRELKKKLVAGPEKRYYELSEHGTGRLQIAILVSFIVVLACAGLTTTFTLGLVPANRLRFVIFTQVLAMLISALMGSNLMVDAVADLLKGRFTVNTLIPLTFAVCLLDAVFCLVELRVPCCAAFCLEMTVALWARLQRHNTEMAQMDTMRKAVRLHGIVRVEDYFEGKDGLLRTEGEVEDFMDNYQKMSGPEVVQSIYAALALVACGAIAGAAGVAHGLSMAVQILSTSLLVAIPATSFIAVTRPMAILEQRLHMVGTVLCGWQGVKDLCGKLVFPINDMDLFPQGSTKLNGVKFYSDRSPDEVVSYTTALITEAGGGLVPVFKNLLASRNGAVLAVENFQNYGSGGIGGEICGEPVLLGTLNFLQDMGVEIPEGTMVNQAVYAAIDGTLCAVYAISYAKMRSAAAGLVTLCGFRKLTPVMLGGDFMLTPDFIRAKFNVKTRRMAFPTREVRTELKAIKPDPQEPVLAMTTREELVSAAYAVSGARALRQSTKLAVGIHLLGGVLGLAIMLVLAFLGNTDLLVPTNILLYQLVWAIPGLLITEWTRTV